MKLIFQHLDTQSLNGDITLFGRTEDGKSVAAHVKGFRPFFYVKVEPSEREQFKTKLKKCLNRYAVSKRIKKIKEEEEDKDFPNIKKYRTNIVKCELVEAQDITDYNELDTPKFMKICANNFFDYYKLKNILTSKLSIISHQTITEDGEEIETSEEMKPFFPQNEVTNSFKTEEYLMGKKYTLYNDQVGYGLQYLISKDIYSCSWMEVEGAEVYEKKTTCDIELNVYTHEQIECNKMAPWRILSYDIESVPHPRGNGKFDFPIAERDPVCTIGAVLQINDEVNKFVWILSPNGDPFNKLSPVNDPPDEYTSEDIKVFHFEDELEMLKSFNRFIVKEDIDIIEGYNSAWFDHPYLFERYNTLMTKRHGVNTVIDNMGKVYTI
jgi:DNA polymerase elongation subunit (family B)